MARRADLELGVGGAQRARLGDAGARRYRPAHAGALAERDDEAIRLTGCRRGVSELRFRPVDMLRARSVTRFAPDRQLRPRGVVRRRGAVVALLQIGRVTGG